MSREDMRAFSIVPCHWHSLLLSIHLSWPLSPCSVYYPHPTPLPYLTVGCHLSLCCFVIPNLQLSLPFLSVIWQSCFSSPLSETPSLFLAVVDTQIASYNHKNQIPVVDTSCMIPVGDLQCLSTPPQDLSFLSLAESTRKPPTRVPTMLTLPTRTVWLLCSQLPTANIIAAHVEEQHRLRPHKSFFSIWNTGPSKKKMPFASRWGQPMGIFCPIAGSLPLLSLAGSTWRCYRFRLSWCNCFPGPSSWTLLPGHSVFCRCRSADRSGSLPPVSRIHEFPAFFPSTCVNVWGMCSVFLQHITNDERGIDGQSLHVHPHLNA